MWSGAFCLNYALTDDFVRKKIPSLSDTACCKAIDAAASSLQPCRPQAPSKMDPRFFDPKHVFMETTEEKSNKETNLSSLMKKVRDCAVERGACSSYSSFLGPATCSDRSIALFIFDDECRNVPRAEIHLHTLLLVTLMSIWHAPQ